MYINVARIGVKLYSLQNYATTRFLLHFATFYICYIEEKNIYGKEQQLKKKIEGKRHFCFFF